MPSAKIEISAGNTITLPRELLHQNKRNQCIKNDTCIHIVYI